MFPPSHILPGAFGIEWGMSREQCLERISVAPEKQTPYYVYVKLLIEQNLYEVYLNFDSNNELERIEVDLRVSRDFKEDFTYDEMERIATEYQGYYDRLVQHYVSILGPPAFSGDSRAEGYPVGLGSGIITYWNNPGGRIQVEFDHPDKEFPMFVKVSCYPA